MTPFPFFVISCTRIYLFFFGRMLYIYIYRCILGQGFKGFSPEWWLHLLCDHWFSRQLPLPSITATQPCVCRRARVCETPCEFLCTSDNILKTVCVHVLHLSLYSFVTRLLRVFIFMQVLSVESLQCDGCPQSPILPVELMFVSPSPVCFPHPPLCSSFSPCMCDFL